MKTVKFLSILSMVAVLAACGSSQPTTQGLANLSGNQVNPYNPNLNPLPNYNPGVLPGNQIIPGVNPGLNPGLNTMMMQPGSVQLPLYANGQFLGYKVRTPLFYGSQPAYGGVVQLSATIAAGENVTINPNAIFYRVGLARCVGILGNTNMMNVGTPRPLTNATVLLNGQPLTQTQVATGGTLTITGQITDQINVRCPLRRKVLADVQYYSVSAMNAAVKEYCVTTANTPMACPY